MFALWLLSRTREGAEAALAQAGGSPGAGVGARSTEDARGEGMWLLWESFGNLS